MRSRQKEIYPLYCQYPLHLLSALDVGISGPKIRFCSIKTNIPNDRSVHWSTNIPTMNKIVLSICLFGLMALALAGHHEDYYAPPHYSYEYKVHDSHTGDIKAQHETREGDVVKGYYTLKEADGTTREVHYTADHHNGFNAEVKKIGHAHHAPAQHGWY